MSTNCWQRRVSSSNILWTWRPFSFSFPSFSSSTFLSTPSSPLFSSSFLFVFKWSVLIFRRSSGRRCAVIVDSRDNENGRRFTQFNWGNINSVKSGGNKKKIMKWRLHKWWLFPQTWKQLVLKQYINTIKNGTKRTVKKGKKKSVMQVLTEKPVSQLGKFNVKRWTI